MSKKIEPLNDQILIQKLKANEVMHGAIIIPDTGKEKSDMGTVISVGPGIYNYHTDKLIPHSVKVGDTVVYPKVGPQVIEVDGEDYIICQAAQLLAKITE